jgi:hypothetical protein
MGADYISKTKKTHRKGWDRAKRKLSLDELLFQRPESIRNILVTPYDSSDLSKFCQGAHYELNVEEGRIFVYSGRDSIGVCKEPPRSVLKAVASLGGKTLGFFSRVLEHSGLIEISVCLDLQINIQVA